MVFGLALGDSMCGWAGTLAVPLRGKPQAPRAICSSCAGPVGQRGLGRPGERPSGSLFFRLPRRRSRFGLLRSVPCSAGCSQRFAGSGNVFQAPVCQHCAKALIKLLL